MESVKARIDGVCEMVSTEPIRTHKGERVFSVRMLDRPIRPDATTTETAEYMLRVFLASIGDRGKFVFSHASHDSDNRRVVSYVEASN